MVKIPQNWIFIIEIGEKSPQIGQKSTNLVKNHQKLVKKLPCNDSNESVAVASTPSANNEINEIANWTPQWLCNPHVLLVTQLLATRHLALGEKHRCSSIRYWGSSLCTPLFDEKNTTHSLKGSQNRIGLGRKGGSSGDQPSNHTSRNSSPGI